MARVLALSTSASLLPSRLEPAKTHHHQLFLHGESGGRRRRRHRPNSPPSPPVKKTKPFGLNQMPLLSAPRSGVRAQAQGDYTPASSGDAVDSDGAEEAFTWSSVIQPFLFPALGGLLFGYDIGATSGASISLQSAELSGTTWFNLSAVQLGLVVSGSLYGALAGSIIAYPIADLLGRRRELITAAALYLVGGLITGYAPDLFVLIIGRFLYGIGIGLAMHGGPLYIAETCPSQIRGTLISLKELFIVLGILLGYLVGSIQISAVGGWRYMYGFSAPIAVLMGIGMWSLPPSPRWLLLRAVQGKGSLEEYKDKAIHALGKLRGRPAGDEVSEGQIDDTLISLKAAIAEQEQEASFWDMFEGASLKAFIIGGGLVLFQQITGQPSVLYYAASILQSAGFSAASDAARVSVVIGIFKLLMTGIAVLKVDNLGRRPLLIGGVVGIVLSLFLLAAYYKILGGFPLVAVGALLLYVGSYQVSFGPISWLVVSEIFPLRTRGRGISLAVLTNFGSNALVTFAFSPLKELLGPDNLFLLFGAIALLSLLFILFYVPETKGLSLEEIEAKILK
ncbi:D-xylose-proton symporter-like 3, chloroplastic [Elaeis guineensis]|uniref:D-xylose-proton symporter-like 3, chloroplastic n=1 Tax=Elaeis guineensis var. tenera TaxID=51953 RepID=A0A6I9QEI2_ELAGV|nr:D-xylose-proton symporter-like 3, chloroplastic [Elaeis guineensis]XP_010907807.1 D-xylose-proton symporter-like 3, chloroplastic [Elaeis guineensis]